MKSATVKFVLQVLTDKQEEHRVETCDTLKQQFAADPDFLSMVITGDESGNSH